MKSEGKRHREHRACDASRATQQADHRNGAAVPIWKRVLDLHLIVFSAPVWLPAMIGIGALIKIVSRGPVLFRQERIGLGGRRFACLKFRTMHAGTNTVAHEKYLAELIQSNRPMTKLDGHDPRLIPLARLLRSSGFDELPQLLNVIRGEMSIVGPRPCTPKEYEAYSNEQQARTGTLPGLTGLWQVNGKNNTTFSEMIALDLRYVNAMSLRLDLAIILRTPLVLLEQVSDTIFVRKNDGSSSGEALPTQARKRIALNDSNPSFLERNAWEATSRERSRPTALPN